MATRSQDQESLEHAVAAGAGHDAFVRANVKRGLEQSRNREAMISIEQVWRDLGIER